MIGVLMSPACSVHRLNPDYHVLQDVRLTVAQRVGPASDWSADAGAICAAAPELHPKDVRFSRGMPAGFEKCIDQRRLYIATSRLIL
jgi:hypothetical protein